MTDLKAFYSNLMGLAEVLGGELTELKLEFYRKALDKYSDDQVQKAIILAATSLKWFPKPVELIELIEGKTEDHALLEWDSVCQAMQRIGSGDSVVFENGKTAKVVEMMGGWVKINEMKADEVKWRRKEFMEIYKSLTGEYPQKKLAGRFELENSARGLLEHVPPPRVIGHHGYERLPQPITDEGGVF